MIKYLTYCIMIIMVCVGLCVCVCVLHCRKSRKKAKRLVFFNNLVEIWEHTIILKARTNQLKQAVRSRNASLRTMSGVAYVFMLYVLIVAVFIVSYIVSFFLHWRFWQFISSIFFLCVGTRVGEKRFGFLVFIYGKHIHSQKHVLCIVGEIRI